MRPIPDDIVAAAKGAQAKHKVPASVSIAQWALESGWGAHSPGNNPFGIKKLPGYNIQTLMTTEFYGGAYHKVPQVFAAFPSIAAAFEVHARLLAQSHTYAPAMAALPDLGAFVQRMAAHYATDPHYSDKILGIIRANDLTRYDT
jgi:flagellum-specific peptidoglycan hydrolase FlgJ